MIKKKSVVSINEIINSYGLSNNVFNFFLFMTKETMKNKKKLKDIAMFFGLNFIHNLLIISSEKGTIRQVIK